MREVNPQLQIADGTYMMAKLHATAVGTPQRITIPIIERRLGLRPGQLRAYRANYYSRKDR